METNNLKKQIDSRIEDVKKDRHCTYFSPIPARTVHGTAIFIGAYNCDDLKNNPEFVKIFVEYKKAFRTPWGGEGIYESPIPRRFVKKLERAEKKFGIKRYTGREIDAIHEKESKGGKTLQEIKEYEHYLKLTKFYVVHGFNSEGEKIQEYCYLAEEFSKTSKKFKNFVRKYDSAVKAADLSKGPSFKLHVMKNKLEKLAKKEQIKK